MHWRYLPLVSGETLDALSGRRVGVDATVGGVDGSVGCVGTGGGGVAVDIVKLELSLRTHMTAELNTLITYGGILWIPRSNI